MGINIRGEKGNKGLYIVNAQVTENKLCIGQERIQEKSNEICAIPNGIKEIRLPAKVFDD